MTKQDKGMDVFEKIKVVLNLYPEEIHILTNKKDIQTFYNLDGKRVSVGAPGGGTAVTAAVLFNIYDIKSTVSEEPFEEAVKKMDQGTLDAVIFVGGAPVPFIGKLDNRFHFRPASQQPDIGSNLFASSTGKAAIRLGWSRHGNLRCARGDYGTGQKG